METVLKLLDELRDLREILAHQEKKIAMLESQRFGGPGVAGALATETDPAENEIIGDVQDEMDSMEMFSCDDMESQSPSSSE